MKPLVERLAKEYAGSVTFKLLNVDQDKDANDLANKYGVQFVPTFYFVQADGSSEQKVGSISEEDFRSKLDALK